MTSLGSVLSADLAALAPGVAALGSLAAVGVLGVMDSILGDEDEDGPDDGGDGGGDDLFGDVDGGGGDEFAFDDGGGGDDFDDFDMDGVDDGAMEAGGGNYQQLEGRVEEMEAELETLSSTVSTVRTENEQIGESVQEVEENVRKLLDIYKMVTKGVNPFVDETGADALGGPGGGGGSLGIFDDEDDAGDDDLDEDVADAEAEEFFEDDIDDEGGAKSFDDLREEYEEGEAEWAEEEDLDEEDADEETDADAEDEETDEDEAADSDAEDADEDESTETPADPADPFGVPTVEPAASAGADPSKPYLEAVPPGFVADLVVLQWVEFLVGESSPAGAERAVSYYQRVDWITDAAADQLRAYLDGHSGTDGGERGSLSMDHHRTSLRFIARLNGDLESTGLGGLEGASRRMR